MSTRAFLRSVYSGRQAIGVISDDTLLKDILNVTVGIESKTFEYLARDKAFRVARPQSDAFRIKTCGPASLSSYLQRFANIGTNLVRLEFVANVMRQDISSYGQIGLAFAHSMSSFLSFIKTCLVAVPNMLNLRTEYQHESRLALSRLYEAYRDPDYFLSILATICGFENVNSIESNYEPPRGGVLLSRLYDAACTLGGIINHESEGKPLNEHFQKRDQVLQLIIFGFIQHASRPYFTWIEQWLGLPASGEEKFETLGGLLEQMTDVWDPYEEFFIKNFSESTNEEILQPETAGDLFWTNGWQINRNVTIPSFLESGVARQLLHAGKYLRLLRHCQPHHPLVQLQDQGTEIRSLLRHHGRLRWMWLARDAKLFLETSDVVVSAIKETVTSQQRRAKADSVRDNHHDEGGLSLKERVALAAEKHLIEDKERKAALIEEQLREQEKKQSLQAEIDTFKDDQAAFAKRSQEQETAQKLQEQQRDEAAKQKRQQFVQEEKKRLLAEYKAKMDRLQKREDILRWQASRLALHERRKALLKDERNIETVSTDIDTRESTSPGGATFGEDPNLHDAMTETAEEINTALRIKDVDQNPTIAPGRPSIAVEANPISLGEEGILLSETPRSEDVVHPVTAKTGAETITFPVPAKEGKGFSDPNVSSRTAFPRISPLYHHLQIWRPCLSYCQTLPYHHSLRQALKLWKFPQMMEILQALS
ncbi:Spc98 family-domain-containing protein [Phlyctochytrium arcticum]|nr:Spc98 family-domain-containing protein [Phlyctochytrium arcticum]